METLTFKAIKAIIDNLDFAQTVELSQLLNEKVNQMKLITIKEALIEKFQTDEYLRQFLPLITKIDKISASGDTLKMEFQDEPRYQLILDLEEDNEVVMVKIYGDMRIGFNRTVRDWKSMNRSADPTTYQYLTNFGNIFLPSFFLENEEGDEEYPLWGSSIKDFLSPDESTLKL